MEMIVKAVAEIVFLVLTQFSRSVCACVCVCDGEEFDTFSLPKIEKGD